MSAADSAMSAESGAAGANSLGAMLPSVRRFWWVVVAVLWLAILGALVTTTLTPTTYVGRTSLIVASNDRSPEQDAVLVQGYVAYFDNTSYQQQLLAQAGLDANTTVSAEAAAGSPILVVSATTSDADSAQSSAIAAARAFKEDINKIHDQKIAAELTSLQDELDSARTGKGRDDQELVASLQEQIRQLHADQDNVLQELQSRGGVTVEPPSLFGNLVLAAAGGLFIGVLLALALGRFSPRLRSGPDVENKVGLNTLVELPGSRTRRAQVRQAQRLRQLANILRARLAGPGVVAITQAADGDATHLVARGVAMELATQGYSAVLVRVGHGTEFPSSGNGKSAPVAQLDVPSTRFHMRTGPVPGVSLLDMDSRFFAGGRRLSTTEVTERLELEQLAPGAFIIIEAPTVINSAAAQAASLAADATLLVIDTKVAKVTETREAVGVLRESGVVLLGAVLTSTGNEEGGPDGNTDWSWWPASTESTEDSSKLDRALRSDSVDPAQDAARNGASSRKVQTGKG